MNKASVSKSLYQEMFPSSRSYSLNSNRVVTRQLQTLVDLLELPIGALALETHQHIEGRLLDFNHKPENVQIIVE